MGKIKLRRLDDKTLEIELEGEDHTIANLIAKYAVRKDRVRYAAYNIPHPLISNPIVVITTDGSVSPLEVFKEVLREVLRDIDELEKRISEVLGSAEKGV